MEIGLLSVDIAFRLGRLYPGFLMRARKPTYELATRLQELREEKGWTIDQVASRLPDYSRAAIGFMFAGTQGNDPAPYLGTKKMGGKSPLLEALAKVIGLPIEEAWDLALSDSAHWRKWIAERNRKTIRAANERYMDGTPDEAFLLPAGA